MLLWPVAHEDVRLCQTPPLAQQAACAALGLANENLPPQVVASGDEPNYCGGMVDLPDFPELPPYAILPEDEPCRAVIRREGHTVYFTIPGKVLGRIEVDSECGGFEGVLWLHRNTDGSREVYDYLVWATELEIRSELPSPPDDQGSR